MPLGPAPLSPCRVHTLPAPNTPPAVATLPSPPACPPKGFTAHVLGYTVHAVIEAVAQVGQPGCLDDSLLMILPLMEVGRRVGLVDGRVYV